MYERLLDKTIQPDFEALAAYCGDSAEGFRALNAFLSDTFFTAQQIRFPYGKAYGWCVTHRKGKKLICDVFAEAGAFTVMMRLSDAQYAGAYPALAPYAQAYIDARYPCGDGGWIQYRVDSAEKLNDIRMLLTVKCGGAR